MKRRLTDWLKKKLRDPIWQSIGVFLTLIALVTPLIIARFLSTPHVQSPNRMIIGERTSKFLTDFPESVNKRMRFFVDGKEERDLRLFIFTVWYLGNEPIRPTDFYTPIRGSIPINRKIIGVQKASDIVPPSRLDREKGDFVPAPRPPISFEVEIIDQQAFQVKPLLMNPGEWFRIEVYTAEAKSDAPSPSADSVGRYKLLSSEISWDCRVAGVECPSDIYSNDAYEDFLGEDKPWFLRVSISHEGWGVYLILIFSIIGLLLMVLLAKAAGVQKAHPLIQIILFSIATALSITGAEVASDWLFTKRIFGIVIDEGQPVYAYIIFWSEVLIIIVLAAISIWKRKNKSSRPRRRARPIEEES